jgi:hypothetical protein
MRLSAPIILYPLPRPDALGVSYGPWQPYRRDTTAPSRWQSTGVLGGLARLDNLGPSQRQATHRAQCGVEVE